MKFHKKLFTIIEIVVVTAIVGMIFVTVISLYSKTLATKIDIEAKQSLIYGSYGTLERLNVLMKDYTIDYEEYFNRMVVGCHSVGGTSFSWTGAGGVTSSGYCDRFTTYGNSNWNSTNWIPYNCTSNASAENGAPNYVMNDANVLNGSGCWNNNTYGNGKPQAYGEYKLQFVDVKKDVNNTGGMVGDDDDRDLGKGPIAIADNNNVQELYLISKDGKKRIIIRRAFLGSGNWDMSGTAGDSDIDKLYNLQMLKLKGFNAGKDHSFAGSSDGEYNGKVDTRACDTGEGYVCNGASLGGIYSGYHLPSSVDDGFVNVLGNDITITDWKLQIYPVKKSTYSFQEDNQQLNPYIKIYLKTKLYGQPWSWKINPGALDSYEMTLQTTFNVRNNY